MRFLRTVFAGSFAAMTFSQLPAASADPSLVWQFTRFKDVAAKNVDAAQLVYAIPETDAIAAAATCNAGNAGKVNLSFSANVTLPDKAQLMVRLFGLPVNATAIIPESGEGLAGFGVILPVIDPFFIKLVSKTSLTYGVESGAERNIPLSKGKVAIRKFIKACKAFAGPPKT